MRGCFYGFGTRGASENELPGPKLKRALKWGLAYTTTLDNETTSSDSTTSSETTVSKTSSDGGNFLLSMKLTSMSQQLIALLSEII